MTFTMTVFPDGRVILSTPEALTPKVADTVRRAWADWRKTPDAMLLIQECLVQHATSVSIDLPEPASDRVQSREGGS